MTKSPRYRHVEIDLADIARNIFRTHQHELTTVIKGSHDPLHISKWAGTVSGLLGKHFEQEHIKGFVAEFCALLWNDHRELILGNPEVSLSVLRGLARLARFCTMDTNVADLMKSVDENFEVIDVLKQLLKSPNVDAKYRANEIIDVYCNFVAVGKNIEKTGRPIKLRVTKKLFEIEQKYFKSKQFNFDAGNWLNRFHAVMMDNSEDVVGLRLKNKYLKRAKEQVWSGEPRKTSWKDEVDRTEAEFLTKRTKELLGISKV